MLGDNKTNLQDTKFQFSARAVSIALGVIGFVCIVISEFMTQNLQGGILVTIGKIISVFGTTLLGSCIISLLLELNTLKEQTTSVIANMNAQTTTAIKEASFNMLDSIFKGQSSYLSDLSDSANEALRLNLYAYSLNQKSNHGYTQEEVRQSAISTYDKLIMNTLTTGILCDLRERKINVKPNGSAKDPEYLISIKEKYTLQFQTDDAYKSARQHRFAFISEKQSKSFRLKTVVLNNENITDKCLLTYENPDRIAESSEEVGNRTFVYRVKVAIPFEDYKSSKTIQYTIEYQYTNYEQSTYLTSALNYLTRSLNETYSLEGEFANSYIIHGFTHFPYYNLPGRKILLKRTSSSSLQCVFEDIWQLPDTGISVVVRRKDKFTEDLHYC